MRVFQINTTLGVGSTGKIALEIGRFLVERGHDCCIAYSRGKAIGDVEVFRVGNKADLLFHGLTSLFFDRHGLASYGATKKLVRKIAAWQPDLIHLHNIHGYYLNYRILFSFLQRADIPVVWTFHDSWPFTGHCTYFDNINCKKWIEGCYKCPKTNKYPRSLFWDRSRGNYFDKKLAFTSLKNLTVVTPSRWLQSLVKQSYFKSNSILSIHNGIDTKVFNNHNRQFTDEVQRLIKGRKIILGVANIWDARKGLTEFIKLSSLISPDFVIVLIGKKNKPENTLPANIISIERTNNSAELSVWYANSFVFVNPTWQDNFPTTNIEALACGTPVITYKTGGSPESIDSVTGSVIDKGDYEGIWNAIRQLDAKDYEKISTACRQRALALFDKNNRFNDYLDLYQELTATKN